MRDIRSQGLEQRGERQQPARELQIPPATPTAVPPYVDPAAEAMSSNPNLSPPIHPKREQ